MLYDLPLETRLEDRAGDYSSQRPLNVLICSWNIDSCKPSDLIGANENTKFLEECIGSAHRPDIIVFGFQEVIDLNDRKLAASEYFSSKLQVAISDRFALGRNYALRSKRQA
jgi:hypothetical protein